MVARLAANTTRSSVSLSVFTLIGSRNEEPLPALFPLVPRNLISGRRTPGPRSSVETSTEPKETLRLADFGASSACGPEFEGFLIDCVEHEEIAGTESTSSTFGFQQFEVGAVPVLEHAEVWFGPGAAFAACETELLVIGGAAAQVKL